MVYTQDTRQLIGAKLKDYRQRAGMSLKEVAESLGKSVAAVSHWETGRRSPDPDTFVNLCVLYGIDTFHNFNINHNPDDFHNLPEDEIKLLNIWRRLDTDRKAALLVLLSPNEIN